MKKIPARKTAALLTVGSELLKGSTLNTNAAFLGQRLLAAGFRVQEQITCDDVIAEIQEALSQLLKTADVVIVSGGLGTTPDDVTRDAIAGYFKKPLVLCAPQWRRIVQLYQRAGRQIPGSVRREALYPKSGIPLLNRYGIALGFCLRQGTKHIIVLPGVPRELESLIDDRVLPYLKKIFKDIAPKFPLVIKTVGLSEPAVMEMLGDHFLDSPCEFGIYPHPGEVTLRIYFESRELRHRLRQKALKALKDFTYAEREVTLAQAVGKRLVDKGMRVGVAESCTGGLLAAELTSQAGSSRYFQGGVVAYDNRMKVKLGLSRRQLARYGAVSSQTACALSMRAAQFTGADWGVGITGVAGPGGGTKAKPVGTVHIAICGPRRKLSCEQFMFSGSRSQVQRRAVAKSLEMLWIALK